jgi:hypothetical protein
MKTLIGCSVAVALLLDAHGVARATQGPTPTPEKVGVCALQDTSGAAVSWSFSKS